MALVYRPVPTLGERPEHANRLPALRRADDRRATRGRRVTGYHGFYGRRPLSDWGEGDTRAEYAEGDVVYIAPDTACVLDKGRVETGPGVYRVVSVFSIGEDASFYYRVSRMEPTGRGDRWRTDWDRVSGRVHVIPGQCDYTAGWVLLHRAVPPP